MTKQELKNEIQSLQSEMQVSFVKACQAMQGAAAKMGNEEMITAIHNIKMESLNF